MKTKKENGGKMIVACIGLYGERLEQAKQCIEKLRPSVDRYVVIVDETVTEKQKKQLKKLGCEVYFHPWEDSMVKMRNQYLNKVQTGDWVIVHDPDECYNDLFCRDVRRLCSEAQERGFRLLLINSHDINIDADGKKHKTISDFFKNLIFQKIELTHYEGVGEVTEVHETLIIPGDILAVKLPKEKYWYEHTKYWWEVWERAARNVFIAGGGNNVGEHNPAWKPLRRLCDELKLENWTQARAYFRKGKIDARLKTWLWDNRYEGFDFQHEMMEFGRWYFEYLHPEEAEGWKPVTELKKDSPPEVMHFVEQCYMKVLGRHADQQGKEEYTNAILSGKLDRDQLIALLKQSREYKRKTPTSEGEEKMKIRVPIDVNVKLTEGVIIEAIMQSKLFWKTIKPRYDVGMFLEVALTDKWEGFVKWFYETKPSLEEFNKKLKEYQ